MAFLQETDFKHYKTTQNLTLPKSVDFIANMAVI